MYIKRDNVRLKRIVLDSQMSSMFISSLWDVKEPNHYSRRVGDKVPGVVAVLFSPAEVAGLAVMSLTNSSGRTSPKQG